MILWHNPRCSKSRQALALLEENGITPQIRRYLDNPPSLEELRAAQTALGVTALQMMRPREPAFREMGLTPSDADETLLQAMARQPKLIERPILFNGNKAAIGRPPEALLDLL